MSKLVILSKSALQAPQGAMFSPKTSRSILCSSVKTLGPLDRCGPAAVNSVIEVRDSKRNAQIRLWRGFKKEARLIDPP